MPLDSGSIYKVPDTPAAFAQQNIFGGIYQYKTSDSIGIDLSTDFIFTRIDKKNYFGVQPQVALTLNHFLQIGAYCSFIPTKTVTIDSAGAPNTALYFNRYTYCGNSMSYIPFAEHMFHPKVSLYAGLGRASGNIYNSSSLSAEKTSYTYYVVKPVVSLESNVFTFFKWTLGLGYRMQLSSDGPSKDLQKKASGVEVSTGLAINVR